MRLSFPENDRLRRKIGKNGYKCHLLRIANAVIFEKISLPGNCG